MSTPLTPDRDDAAAYALGALDASERAAFEAELARSPALAAEAQAYAEVAALLSLAAPRATPPASLRDRILGDARSVRPITGGASSSTRNSVDSSGSARPAGPAPLPATAAGRSSGPGTVIPWLAAAAAIVGVVWTGSQLSTEREARLTAETTNAALRTQVASLDSVVSALLAPDVETVKLTATGQPPSARLYWNTQSNQVVFAAFNLRPAPTGRTYQLWGIETGKNPVSLGTFNTRDTGELRASFRVPPGVRIAVGAVTEEPAGGSPQPTTTPFLVGQLRSAGG